MAVCPHPSPPSPPAGDDLFHRAVRAVEAAVFAGPPAPTAEHPHLVILRPGRHRLDIGYLPVDGDPVGLLAGFRAPRGWRALGVTGPGHARRADPGHPPGGPGDDRSDRLGPVQVLHVVSREGDTVTVHRRLDGGAADQRVRSGPPGAGVLHDHLCRALGLATAPPPPSTVPLWTRRWLDGLVRAGAGGGLAGASWLDLCRRHPVVALARAAGGPTSVADRAARQLDRSVAQLASTWTWAALRAATEAGSAPVDTVGAELAAWMDDGLFARHLLGALPTTRDLLEALADQTTPEAFQKLLRICRAWRSR